MKQKRHYPLLEQFIKTWNKIQYTASVILLTGALFMPILGGELLASRIKGITVEIGGGDKVE